jgi:hypothetical protein
MTVRTVGDTRTLSALVNGGQVVAA